MKIEHEVVRIDNIQIGECFEDEREYYLKSEIESEEGSRWYRCVNLKSGELKAFKGSHTVYRVAAKFVVSSLH